MAVKTDIFYLLSPSLNQVLIVLLLCVLVTVVYKLVKPSPWDIPPGPFPWPIVGNINVLKPIPDDPHGSKRLWQLAKKYNNGGLVSLKIGKRYAIGVNRYEDIRYLRSKDEFCGQFDDNYGMNIGFAGLGGENMSPKYKQLRKFVQGQCKSYCSGTNKCQEVILDGIEELFQKIDRHDKKALYPYKLFKHLSLTVLLEFMFQRKLKDEEMDDLLKIVEHVFTGIETALTGSHLPLVSYLPGDTFLIRQLRQTMQQLKSLFSPLVQQHFHNHKMDDPTDFIDSYITRIAGASGDTFFTKDHMMNVINNMIVGASDALGLFLSWFLLYMVNKPEVQEKIRDEIRGEIGERTPTMADRPHLPFTDAVIHEICRLHPLAPFQFNATVDKPMQYNVIYTWPHFTFCKWGFKIACNV